MTPPEHATTTTGAAATSATTSGGTGTGTSTGTGIGTGPATGPATAGRTVRTASTGPEAAQPLTAARGWRLVAGLVLAVAVLAGATLAWSQLAQQEERHRQSYSEPIHTVEVDGGAADVTVSAGDDGRVVVNDLVGWVLGRPTVSQEVTGDTLKVSVDCPRGTAVLGCAATVDITVPASTALRVATRSGRAAIHGVSGEVHASTEEGRLELRDLAGRLWVKTDSGQIDGKGLSSPTVELAADSGQSVLDFARPPEAVKARLASGPLIVGLPDDGAGYRIDFLTIDGRLAVARGIEDATAPRLLDLSTATAPINITRGKAPAPTH
ncbi:hypothetical protein ACGFX4_17445 [Kitasatospora sp. NPDC048365]|uniref:hypothetical protein n=1 Tax=Kitasatospora sp. NPDC048365 TaxID=3364050 RepID=UPI00371EC8A6